MNEPDDNLMNPTPRYLAFLAMSGARLIVGPDAPRSEIMEAARQQCLWYLALAAPGKHTKTTQDALDLITASASRMTARKERAVLAGREQRPRPATPEERQRTIALMGEHNQVTEANVTLIHAAVEIASGDDYELRNQVIDDGWLKL